jgi:hypothetical protein
VVKTLIAALALLLVSSPALHAQTDSSIAVGVALTLYDPASEHTHNPPSVGLIARMRRGSGLGATIGLEWYKSEVQTTIGGQLVPLGDMNARPVMAGVSFTRQYSRYALSGALVAGYSFNSLRATPAAHAAYRDRFALPDARIGISNCFAFRPDVTLWYELGHHLAASASIAYVYARPTVTADSAAGRRVDPLNISATVITFGLAYGVF